MDVPEISFIRCKSCLRDFAVNTIQKHLANRPSCKSEYSKEQSDELNEICEAHQIQKRKASYQKRKKTIKVSTNRAQQLT